MIYCLVPSGGGHAINERRPGYPALEVGYLRKAYLPEHEGEGWVVRDMGLGHVFRGKTPEAALVAFDVGRVRLRLFQCGASEDTSGHGEES